MDEVVTEVRREAHVSFEVVADSIHQDQMISITLCTKLVH
jgi:hypothetical protein